VLLLYITEVFSHGQTTERNTQTGARWLVHLAEDQSGILQHVGFIHFDPQVVTLTGTFTDTGEYRSTAEVPGNTGNHFLDENGFTNTGTTEQTDLPTLNVRSEQVNHLNTGLQHFGGAFKVGEVWRFAVNRPAFFDVELGNVNVEGVAQGVKDVTFDDVADGHRDWRAGVEHFLTSNKTVGGFHSDSTHEVLTQVLRSFESDGGGLAVEGQLYGQSIVDLRHCIGWKFSVNNRT